MEYNSPSWIEDEGGPWKHGTFNQDAFDPSAPYSPKGKTYRFESNPKNVLEDPFDLNNLRIFRPETVRQFLVELETLATETGKKLVAMIGHGGTLAMLKRGSVLKAILDPIFLLHKSVPL